MALPAGESTATLLINGEETSLSDTVTLDAAGDVYFRLQNGELKDSVNETIVHTAAWVGTLDGFSYLKDASDPESAYTIEAGIRRMKMRSLIISEAVYMSAHFI